jgi:hypothetical protein
LEAESEDADRRLEERRVIKLIVLKELLKRRFGVALVPWDQHSPSIAGFDENAGCSMPMADSFHDGAAREFAEEMLSLLGLDGVNPSAVNFSGFDLHEVVTAEEMVARLPDGSPRALIDTITAPDTAYHGMDMIEMIRVGDTNSYDRCLRQLAGDGFT